VVDDFGRSDYNLGDSHFARGNVFNALLYNGDPRSLIENAIGGSGVSSGQPGVNHFTGNAGGDAFRFMSVEDSRPGAADVLMDFVRGADGSTRLRCCAT
jgi:serralysin